MRRVAAALLCGASSCVAFFAGGLCRPQILKGKGREGKGRGGKGREEKRRIANHYKGREGIPFKGREGEGLKWPGTPRLAKGLLDGIPVLKLAEGDS